MMGSNVNQWLAANFRSGKKKKKKNSSSNVEVRQHAIAHSSSGKAAKLKKDSSEIGSGEFVTLVWTWISYVLQ
ncbi:hypothetical protein ACH5RR_023947 [Cinchona calisaya]|uniref:Uncharacterized protein n=1 Tax=Cinchona calisaya TaxID=153742 RepID=A0ABD2ZFF4_9GENT